MSYLPADEVADAEAVMEHGAAKHPGEEWKTIPREDHLEHAISHIVEYDKGGRIDHESGRSPLAHAVCRLLFVMYLDKHGEAP